MVRFGGEGEKTGVSMWVPPRQYRWTMDVTNARQISERIAMAVFHALNFLRPLLLAIQATIRSTEGNKGNIDSQASNDRSLGSYPR